MMASKGTAPKPSRPSGLDLESSGTVPALTRTMLTPGGPQKPNGDHFAALFWRFRHTTVAYCFVFWSFGMCVAFLGPTLLDLACKTSTIFATMSWVFLAQSLFVLVGSACAGVLVKRLSTNQVLLVSTIMLAVTLAIIPECNVLLLLALVLAIMGFFMGTIDTVANLCMIQLYGKDISPFLQLLHFFYGFGAFVSPLIAEPFLLTVDCDPLVRNVSRAAHQGNANVTAEALEALREAQALVRSDYAFWIMALLQIPVIAVVCTLLAKDLYSALVGSKGPSADRSKEDYQDFDQSARPLETESANQLEDHVKRMQGHHEDQSGSLSSEASPATRTQVAAMTALTALLLFLFDGLQSSYGGFVYSYAVKSVIDLPKSKAAYLNAYFWGMFALGRLFSVMIATKLAPSLMLLCNVSGCFVAMLLMLCLNESREMLYVGTCLFGIFLSSVYPTAISLAEQYIDVTSTITSCIVVGASTGEMLLPVVVGHAFHHQGPKSFLVAGFIVCLLTVFVYVAICVTGSTIVRRKSSSGILGALTSLVSHQNEDSGLMRHQVKYYSRMSEGSPVDVCTESIELESEEINQH